MTRSQPDPTPTPTPGRHSPAIASRKRRTPALYLLILPYLGLCFPSLYSRATPELLGMPFFYWYQFVWVLAASAILAIVYTRIKT